MHLHHEDEVLAEAIGSYALSVLGRDNIRTVHVAYNPSSRHAVISLALRDTSLEAQTEVMARSVELEEHYDTEGIETTIGLFEDAAPVFTDEANTFSTAKRLVQA